MKRSYIKEDDATNSKNNQSEVQKKIIPVVSDSSESSPFPEGPSTPYVISYKAQRSSGSMQALGQKLQNSYSKYIQGTDTW